MKTKSVEILLLIIGTSFSALSRASTDTLQEATGLPLQEEEYTLDNCKSKRGGNDSRLTSHIDTGRHLSCRNLQHLGLESRHFKSKRSPLTTHSYGDEPFFSSSPGEILGEGEEGWNLTTSSSLPDKEEDFNSTLSLFYQRYDVEKWKVYGLFQENYLSQINKHWLEFPPASTASHHTLAIMYLFIMTLGCGGNLLVIIMFLRCRSLRTPANYLILNLAVSDFIMLSKMPVFIINSWYEGPVMGSIGCQIYGFLGGLTGTTSIMTLAAIAVDRYCVIVFPLNPYKRTTHARAILMIVFTWFYSAIFSTMPLLGINHYVSEGFLTSCSFDYLRDDAGSRIFIFIFFLAAWVCPLSCIVFSYFAIFRMVVQAEKLDFFNGDKTRESFKYKRIQDKLRKDVKIALLTTFIILVWVLAWTPYAIVALLGIFGQKQLITPVVSAIPGVFCKLSSSVNPFIYSINHPRFQKELRTKFQNMCKCHNRSALRKCSPRSVSFGVSVSDNYEFQTRKFDYGSEMNTTPDEGVSLKLAVQAEQSTPHSRNKFNKQGQEYSYNEIGIKSSMKKTNKINSIGVSVVCQQRQDQVREPNGRYPLFKHTLPCSLNTESQNLSCSPKRRFSEPNLIFPIVATQEPLSNLSRCKSFN